MNTILHTTAYLPPLDYIKSIMDAENVLIEVCENYQKRSYRNRAVIQSANGPLVLSIPVNKPTGNHTTIDQVTIDYISNWPHDHWHAIQSAYNKSPYFEYYSHLFEAFYKNRWDTLLELNSALLTVILKVLKIQKEIGFTQTYETTPAKIQDYRNLHLWHKMGTPVYDAPAYAQVFDYKHPFESRISILDTLFNQGPQTLAYLQSMKKII